MITWPLESNVIRRGSLNNTFGMVRRYANGSPKPHQGWDFHGLDGITPVYAVSAGKIVAVDNIDNSDYGKTVLQSFEHAGTTYYAFYAHLASIQVISGSAIKINDLIGYVGTTGNAKGMKGPDVHLHFEIREKPYPGLGLVGRISPYQLYKVCPLLAAVDGNQCIDG